MPFDHIVLYCNVQRQHCHSSLDFQGWIHEFSRGEGGAPYSANISPPPPEATDLHYKNLSVGQNRGGGALCATPQSVALEMSSRLYCQCEFREWGGGGGGGGGVGVLHLCLAKFRTSGKSLRKCSARPPLKIPRSAHGLPNVHLIIFYINIIYGIVQKYFAVLG